MDKRKINCQLCYKEIIQYKIKNSRLKRGWRSWPKGSNESFYFSPGWFCKDCYNLIMKDINIKLNRVIK